MEKEDREVIVEEEIEEVDYVYTNSLIVWMSYAIAGSILSIAILALVLRWMLKG